MAALGRFSRRALATVLASKHHLQPQLLGRALSMEVAKAITPSPDRVNWDYRGQRCVIHAAWSSPTAVQIAFTLLVFPYLLLAYSGQAAYLMNNMDHVQDSFYRSIPDRIYWPVFVVAIAAAIVASQATITATFSIIKQALAHGCFPRVKVVHTSKMFLGQIYIPDINWILMILCISVTASFKNQNQIGNAYVMCPKYLLQVALGVKELKLKSQPPEKNMYMGKNC